MPTAVDAPPDEAWLELPDGALRWLDGRCRIGRQADNDLVLEDASVSRRHAVIEGQAGGFMLSDLRSSNGTYLNRVPIARAVHLQDGDELGFGKLAVRFRCTRPVGPRVNGEHPLDVTQRIDEAWERSCWLMVADLASYSALIAAHGNRGAVEHFQGWIAGLRPLIEGHGGVINSYVGDAVFAWWPEQPESAAQLQAALAAIAAWRPTSPAAFRLSLHHGTALFTRSERGEELAGRDVNFVFRSDKVAKSLEATTILSAAAVRTLGLEGRCRLLGQAQVDGIEGIFAFYDAPDH